MKDDFFEYQAQTTPFPLAMQVSHAKGSYIYDEKGNAHLDFVAGVSACSLGHCHPAVVEAVKKQLDAYMHVMVYGEYIQQPAVELTKLIASQLPASLNTTYLTNSGTEAIEGSLKLARRVTGRSEIIAAKHAYHGNTMGSLSVMGYEERKQAFRPLIPDVKFIEFNNEYHIQEITTKTAGVILETIQGGAGFIQPKNGYLTKVKQRCDEVGALLILDEIQPGIGRTGKLFGFENYNVIPDIVVTGKGLGGGLPVGAFTASKAHMALLKKSNVRTYYHIWREPCHCGSLFSYVKNSNFFKFNARHIDKGSIFRKLLVHKLITEVRGIGLMLIILLPTPELAAKLVMKCKERGLILFFLLFEKRAVRITPPLTISEEEITKGCQIILEVLQELQ